MQREDASRGDAAANHPALCFRDVALNQVARHGQQGRKGERNDKCLLIRQGGKREGTRGKKWIRETLQCESRVALVQWRSPIARLDPSAS